MKKSSKIFKVMYAICVVIVIIAGLYYENGYTDVNVFVSDMLGKLEDISSTVVTNVRELVGKNEKDIEKEEEI